VHKGYVDVGGGGVSRGVGERRFPEFWRPEGIGTTVADFTHIAVCVVTYEDDMSSMASQGGRKFGENRVPRREAVKRACAEASSGRRETVSRRNNDKAIAITAVTGLSSSFF